MIFLHRKVQQCSRS